MNPATFPVYSPPGIRIFIPQKKIGNQLRAYLVTIIGQKHDRPAAFFHREVGGIEQSWLAPPNPGLAQNRGWLVFSHMDGIQSGLFARNVGWLAFIPDPECDVLAGKID